MKHPYFFTVCGIVLDEELYLEEWIEFHRLEGAQHFFIYDNGSTDGTHKILDAYKARGLVTWESILEKPIQFAAYNKCLADHGEKTEWMAFLDTDEFLYCPNQPVQHFLINSAHYEFKNKQIAGIAARWVLYGSNGQEKYENRLVTERFVRRNPEPDKHFKSIMRPEFTSSVGKNPHYFVTHPRSVVIDERGIELPPEYGLHPEDRFANKIRINHYHTKSAQEYVIRKKRPDPGSNVTRTAEQTVESFAAHDRNEIFDPSATKHVNEILKAINDNHTDNPNG